MKLLIKEKPILDYFLCYHRHYGFEHAIYNRYGYDFTLFQNGNIIKAELETIWQHYLEHQHHRDIRFHNVSLLILFSNDNPPPNIAELPPNILHINHEHIFTIVPPRNIYCKAYHNLPNHISYIDNSCKRYHCSYIDEFYKAHLPFNLKIQRSLLYK